MSTAEREAEPLDETPDRYGAFPRLSEAQIERLAEHGRPISTKAGDVLFREGDPTCDFFVILSGSVAIVEGYGGGGERVIGVHGPGRFLGELGLLTGQPLFVTGVVGARRGSGGAGRSPARVGLERHRARRSDPARLSDRGDPF